METLAVLAHVLFVIGRVENVEQRCKHILRVQEKLSRILPQPVASTEIPMRNEDPDEDKVISREEMFKEVKMLLLNDEIDKQLQTIRSIMATTECIVTRLQDISKPSQLPSTFLIVP